MTIDKARRRKAVARWHRRFAIFVSAWLVLLAFSGLLINHAHDWKLDSRPLPGMLQLGVYGVETGNSDFCEPLTADHIDCEQLFARFQLPVGVLLLGARDLFPTMNKNPREGVSFLPLTVDYEERLYLIEGQVLDPAAVLELDEKDWQAARSPAEAITWERFLLDLHAARFLGPAARLFNDLMAAFILILAMSGLWMYLVNRKKS
jgi:hypothetical protein